MRTIDWMGFATLFAGAMYAVVDFFYGNTTGLACVGIFGIVFTVVLRKKMQSDQEHNE